MNIHKKLNIQGMDILIVDDNAKNLQVIGNIIKDLNFSLRFALSGEKALAAIAIKKPDLILLDINMPEMDGFEVCSKIVSNDKTADIPIIFITAAKKDDESIVKGFRVGAVDYITKPFNQEELVARITSHLQLKALRNYLEFIIDEKNTMFSIFSHDIKNPFTGILGLSELSLHQADLITKETLLTNMKLIHESGARIFELLQQLTSWVGLQNGMIEFIPEKIDLGITFEKVINLFSKKAEEKKILITYQIVDIQALGDRNMLETILRNLINNAIKFTKESGRIEITAIRNSEFVQFEIKDVGIGMSKETLNSLLTKMLNPSTYGTIKEKGTGLGIGICKEMIRKMGGEFWIESEMDKGTSVRFTVPIYRVPEEG